MTVQNLSHELDPDLRRDIGKADKPAVPFSLEEHQVPKVLVHGNEDSLFGNRPGQNPGVSGIGAALPGFENVMSQSSQPFGEAATGAPIDEEFHEPVTRTASRESCAMTAWA